MRLGEDNIYNILGLVELEDVLSLHMAFESVELKRICDTKLELTKRWKWNLVFHPDTSYFRGLDRYHRHERFLTVIQIICDLRIQILHIKVMPEFSRSDPWTLRKLGRDVRTLFDTSVKTIRQHIFRCHTLKPVPKRTCASLMADLVHKSDWLHRFNISADNAFFESFFSQLTIRNLHVRSMKVHEFVGNETRVDMGLERWARNLDCTVYEKYLVDRVNYKLRFLPDHPSPLDQSQQVLAEMVWRDWTKTYQETRRSRSLSFRDNIGRVAGIVGSTLLLSFCVYHVNIFVSK